MSETGTARAAWLEQHRDSVSRQRDLFRRVELGWSWARLVTFAGIFVCFIAASGNLLLQIGCPAIATVLFLGCVYQHQRVRARRELADRQLLMVAESQRRCGGCVELIRSFERPADVADAAARIDVLVDDGPSWRLTFQEWDDLDLYAAPVGVFGLLNRTSTAAGARRLRDMLEHPCLVTPRIEARQKAVRWLDQNAAERVRTMAVTAGLRGSDAPLDRFVAAIRQAAPLPEWFPLRGLRLWSLVSFIAFSYAVSQGLKGSSGSALTALLLLVFNGCLFQLVRKPLKAALRPWEGTSDCARGCRGVASIAADVLPEDGALGIIRSAFAAASPGLAALCRRLPWNEAGGPVRDLFNAMVFYDLHLAQTLLARVLEQRNELLRGMSVTMELDALSSLACFAWEQPQACYPTFTTDRVLSVTSGRHPLIDPSHVVANDLRLTGQQRLSIITGSNMAGKSTFLRMAGISTLLGQMGTACCAKTMTLHPVRLMTDLRARDNLAREESYFLAEVRQVRRMIVPPASGEPVLGLIDEPFRGTNSQERVAASLAVVQHLMESSGFFLIATHEQRITELADGQTARNFHFRENLGDDGPTFDYRICEGAATMRNALRVMSRENFPDSVMARAQAWLQAVSAPGEDST